MTLQQIIEMWNANAGGVFVFVLILASLIQITPIKLNPLDWIVKILFKRTDKIEKKLDEHIAQSYRNKIFSFQAELLYSTKHSQEQFLEVIDACDKYDIYVKENNIVNGKATEAIKYIRRVYQKRLDERDFLDLNNAV